MHPLLAFAIGAYVVPLVVFTAAIYWRETRVSEPAAAFISAFAIGFSWPFFIYQFATEGKR